MFRKRKPLQETKEETALKSALPVLRADAEPVLERLEKRVCDLYGGACRARAGLCEAGDVFEGPTEQLKSLDDVLVRFPSLHRYAKNPLAGKTAVSYARREANSEAVRGDLHLYVDASATENEAMTFIRKIAGDQMLTSFLNTDIVLHINILNFENLDYRSQPDTWLEKQAGRTAKDYEALYDGIREALIRAEIRRAVLGSRLEQIESPF